MSGGTEEAAGTADGVGPSPGGTGANAAAAEAESDEARKLQLEVARLCDSEVQGDCGMDGGGGRLACGGWLGGGLV